MLNATFKIIRAGNLMSSKNKVNLFYHRIFIIMLLL